MTLPENTSFSTSVFIMADKHKLAQVVRNITSNALKFTPNQGKVHIFCDIVPSTEKKSTDLVRIHFKDSGVGISKVLIYLCVNK